MHAYAFSVYAIPTGLTALLLLGFGAAVFFRLSTRVSAAFFTLTVATSGWLAAFAMVYLSARESVAIFWSRQAFLAVPLIAPALYHFSVEMLRVQRKWAVRAGWIGAAAFAGLAAFTDVLISSAPHRWWGFYPNLSPEVAVPFLLFFIGYLFASLGEFTRALPKARGVERVRIRLLIIAFIVGYFGCVDFLPSLGWNVFPFGYIGVLGFFAMVAHAASKYGLAPITPQLASREIIETMGDALFVCDRDGLIQSVNPAARSLLGKEGDEIIGKRIEELLAESEGDGALGHKELQNHAEYAFRTASGEPVQLILSIAPVLQKGEAAGAVIIGRDVRDLQRAQRETRRAIALLQSTLDSTTDGILVLDDKAHILTYNQKLLDMFGLPKETMERANERWPFADILTQLANPDEFARTIVELAQQPEAESFDLIEFSDGRRFERHSIARRVEGIASMRVWSFRDVTSRFTAEAALRESEIRYRSLFEQNAAGVCVTSQEGVIADCNTTFAFMLGYKRHDLVGRNMGELYERRFEREELASMLLDATTNLNSVEMELRRKDGSHVWVLQNLVRVGHAQSAVIHATVVDISDRKRAEEQIEYHAYHDVLTHLPNRRLFTDRLAVNLTRARRSGRPLGVMFIDLDHFKNINDTLGHTAGDELLLEMSQRLRRCVREDDTVARLGGDEFTIILADLRHPEDAAHVAQKVIEAVQKPLKLGAVPVEVSASIGIAIYPVDGADAETLLRNADSAMYRAKDSGRNNYQLCTDSMKTRAVERHSAETRLRKAIYGDQLVLHYQPQVGVGSGRIVGAEALVRWNDPERGLIDPAEFLSAAEESRLIVPLGSWVLRAACKQIRDWNDRGATPIRVGINLSARQFLHHDLIEMVKRITEEEDVNAAWLELEISETTAMQSPDVTMNIVRALRAVGVGVALHNFGTGASSITYLRRFALSALKIDGSFIREVTRSGADAALAASIIAMARSLGLRVVAEGVETEAQFSFVLRRQCDEAQGYYFSPPIAAESLGNALAEHRTLGIREPRLRV
jgi:diguanylate cyclase (GGDEF)-like protein/PAS domain S-box-containing protein